MALDPSRVTALFLAAAELDDPAERKAFLDRECQGNPELRNRVEALLCAHDSAAEPGPSPDAPNAGSSANGQTPLVIADRYTLLRKIGEGGMGEVWVAQQTEPVQRQVAIKLIKSGRDSRAVVQRFEQERQALAVMDHPNIARILDGGLTDSGQPYFVMELVDGRPLTEFCDQQKLTPKQRLELFVPICQAVQHAHQKGIVHRDLKPANILVTLVDGRPVPRVIDFGVAKATAGKLIDDSISTQFGTIVGTLEYMSPEQAGVSDGDIDTRADIYALGIILYELLTGLRPIDAHRLRQAALDEIIRIIREEEPSRPSTRLSTNDALPSQAALRQTDPSGLLRLLRGDLDWVVMKCLEKSRDRRYETANGLARDIERFLANEPVEARPPSASYRLAKFVRRNKGKVIAASAVLVALVAGIIGTSIGLYRADRARRAETVQRQRAEQREQMAIDAVKRFRDAVANNPELKNDLRLQPLRKTLLREPLAFFKSLRDRLQADKDTRPESLAQLANAAFELGELSQEIGDKEDALKAYTESLAIRRKLAEDNPTVTNFQADLAAIHNDIGNLLHETGRSAEALKAHQAALAIHRELANDNPTGNEFQRRLALSHNNIGVLEDESGNPADALKAYEAALAIQRKLTDDNPTVTQFQNDLAMSHANIGVLQYESGKPAEALKSYEAGLAIWRKLADENPTVAEFQNNLAKNHVNIGTLLREIGKPDEAIEAYEAARAIQRTLADANPTVTEFQANLAKSHNSIGDLLRRTGKLAEALKSCEAGLAIQRKLADDNPTITEFQANLATSHNAIGNLLSEIGKPTEALAAHEAALVIRETLADDNPTVAQFQANLATSHNNIGNLLSEIGKPDEAMKAYEAALAILSKLADDNPSVPQFQADLATSHNSIGLMLSAAGKQGEALEAFKAALAIRRKLADDNPTVTEFQNGLAESHNNIGRLLHITSKPAEALEAYESARAILSKLADDNPTVTLFQTELALSHNNIGSLLRMTGKPDEAIHALEAAQAILRKLAEDHPDSPEFASGLGATLGNLALHDLDAKRFAEARERLNEAITWQRNALAASPAHPVYRQHLVAFLQYLIKAAGGLGDAQTVAEAQRQLKELAESDPAIQALDAKLAQVAAGQAAPGNKIERLRLALRAYEKGLYSLSARLWREALEADPKLGDDRQAQHRYNAACAAALAAAGAGKDEPPPDDAEKERLRKQARDWLGQELEVWNELLAKATPEQRNAIAQTLNHWRNTDPDLAGIRDKDALAKLPEPERAEWNAFWTGVDAALAKARGE